ncbi:unnamed protein product, partial [Vitis vinifera]
MSSFVTGLGFTFSLCFRSDRKFNSTGWILFEPNIDLELNLVRLNLRLISIGGGSSRGTVLHVLLRI